MATPAELGKWIFLALLVPLLTVRILYRLRRRGEVTVADRQDAIEMVAMAQAAVLMVGIPIAYVFTPLLRFAAITLPAWILVPGVLLFLAGALLMTRTHADLGRNWSQTLRLRQDHTLVTSGVYRHVRHPMYAAFWIIGLSVPFLLHNWIAGYSYLVGFGILYFVRVPREERMMRDAFGEQYEAYQKRTGRVIPRMRS